MHPHKKYNKSRFFLLTRIFSGIVTPPSFPLFAAMQQSLLREQAILKILPTRSLHCGFQVRGEVG
jgi:hypothetical protein